MMDDQDDDGVCALFPFEGVVFGEIGFLVLFWWCLVAAIRD
jgi:hypothetical protein